MAKFCGKCGSILDATGVCKKCNEDSLYEEKIIETINNSKNKQSKGSKKGVIVKYCSIGAVCLIIVILIFALNVFNPSLNIQGQFLDITVCENQTGSIAFNDTNVKCAAINNKNELIMWNNGGWKKPEKILCDVQSIKLFPAINMAIKKDNSLWVWEYNQYEQIGNLKISETPQKLLDSVKSVDSPRWTAKNGTYYCAKGIEGNYWQWGEKKNFRKLDSDEESNNTIIKDFDVTGLIHLYLYADGHLEGEFFDTNSLSHVKETIFDNVEDIEGGDDDKALILTRDGTLYLVCNDSMGIEYPIASKCGYIREMCKDVKAAYCDNANEFCIVLTNDGELYSCGSNEQGCLGNENFSQTATDNSLNLIMRSVEEFGTNDFSNIGTETKLEMASGTGAVSEHQYQYILARKSDGTLYGWGNNKKQQIGTGEKSEIINAPTKIMGDVKKCVSCKGFNFALTNDGNIYRWGYNTRNKVPEKITK